jgi:CDP-diglyceride synthetase
MKMPVRAVWAIAPVLAAGLVHVAVLKTDLLPGLAVPLDRGVHWRGRPLLGPNKTLRGLIVMPLATAVAVCAQDGLERRHLRLAALSLNRQRRVSPWIAGVLLGLAYILAELPNSFIKRQLGIPSGGRARRHATTQYVIDQSDSVIGCILMLRLLGPTAASFLILAGAIGLVAHLAVDGLMHAIGLRD